MLLLQVDTGINWGHDVTVLGGHCLEMMSNNVKGCLDFQRAYFLNSRQPRWSCFKLFLQEGVQKLLERLPSLSRCVGTSSDGTLHMLKLTFLDDCFMRSRHGRLIQGL